MNFKKIFSVVTLLAFSIGILTACGGQKAPVETSGQSSLAASDNGSDATLRVGVLSIDDVLPFVVAEKDGLFKKYGVNVKLFPFKSSIDQSKAFEAGQLDVVMNDMIVQGLMKKSGTDTRIISYAFGANPEEGRFLIVSSPKSDITSPEDLVGKRVAISNNTMMDFLLDQYLDYYKIDRDSVERVNMPDLMLRMETLLAGNDIDAAILPDQLASAAVAQGAKTVIDDTSLDKNFSQSVVLASADSIKNQPEMLKKFTQAYFDAMKRINDHPDQYKALALENAHVPDAIKSTYRMPTYTPKAVPTREEVKRVTDWLVQRQLIDKAYTYEEMVDQQFIK